METRLKKYRECVKLRERDKFHENISGVFTACKLVSQLFVRLARKRLAVFLDLRQSPLLSCVFRRPNSRIDMLNSFEKIWLKIFIVFGDFNCDVLSPTPSNHMKRFLDIANLFQLKQHIREHTRVIEKTE